jgi:outer membrane protein, adhesin transport system
MLLDANLIEIYRIFVVEGPLLMKFCFARSAVIAVVSVCFLSVSSQAEPLKDSIAALLKSHQRIQAARADVASAGEGAQVARKAFLPTLDITTHYGFEEQRKDNADNTHMPSRELDFKVTQLLYDFGSTSIGKQQAELAVSQAEVILDATEQGLILEAVSAHLGLISANEIVNFAKGSEANIKRQTELEDARVQRGSGFSTDVLQAKAQLAGAQARRVQAEGALAQARYRYQAVFGVMPEKVAGLKKPRVPLDLLPGTMEEAVELALKTSKQLEVTQIVSDVARAQTKKSRADGLFPVFNLIGENKYKQDVGGTEGFKGEQIIRVEATYSFNLWGASLNTIEASKQAYLASSSRVMDAKNIVAEQVRAAWQQLHTSRENAQFLRNQANIASEFLELARKERRLGRRSLIDVLAGETALINASSDAASAETNIATSAFTLLGVMGNLTLDAVQ